MWGYLSFLWQNWELVTVGLGVVAAFCVAAWFTRNWKFAALGLMVLAGILLWQGAYTTGFNARENQDSRDRIKFLQGRLDAIQATSEANRKRAEEAAAEIQRLTDLAAQTPPNTTPALPRDAVGRIRAIK